MLPVSEIKKRDYFTFVRPTWKNSAMVATWLAQAHFLASGTSSPTWTYSIIIVIKNTGNQASGITINHTLRLLHKSEENYWRTSQAADWSSQRAFFFFTKPPTAFIKPWEEYCFLNSVINQGCSFSQSNVTIHTECTERVIFIFLSLTIWSMPIQEEHYSYNTNWLQWHREREPCVYSWL